MTGTPAACRLPREEDNCAIATATLQPGDSIPFGEQALSVKSTVLEGHRLAVRTIAAGQLLLSWGLPFGIALKEIQPGDYVCNAQMIEALRLRNLPFEVPADPNFQDYSRPFEIDSERFRAGIQVPFSPERWTFQGYQRPGERGVGTRNYIVLLGTSSRTAAFVRVLDQRLRPLVAGLDGLDGIVAVAHTEGGSAERPNNLELVLRTLSGFFVHPNAGAVLAVDQGSESVTNARVREYLEANDYPFRHVLHRFLSLREGFEKSLDRAEEIVRGWIDPLCRMGRTSESLSQLRIALQCGGSDAFSGVSANPLAAWIARALIQFGGSANLAETDELIGAESYVLNNVRDLETARSFVAAIDRFKQRVAWHGHSAEENPSGGNRFRGLYNITLKSIGAAMKKHPEVRLDHVIAYGERMRDAGFYFMDSPGNDLESVAGQVASGANLILFTTGNGSITNFPFVPTLKIMTTSRRFQLLEHEMDVNAGQYLEGRPMEELGAAALDLTVETASGKKTRGEQAGHFQVSIWRDWNRSSFEGLESLLHSPEPQPRPILLDSPAGRYEVSVEALQNGERWVTDRVGLILPTSLCSGQIARMAVERLNRAEAGNMKQLSRFVALPHTEGCGVSGGSSEVLFARILIGYLTHPLVPLALLLEHGCEKTHNDYFRSRLVEECIDPARFGWASVQLDGGIERVIEKMERWFEVALRSLESHASRTRGLDVLSVGLLAGGPVAPELGKCLSEVARAIVHAGGQVVVSTGCGLASCPEFLPEVRSGSRLEPSLNFAQRLPEAGFYVMDSPTRHWVELLSGLGATGVELFLALAVDHPLQGHPLVPLVQFAAAGSAAASSAPDLDLVVAEPSWSWPDHVLRTLAGTASRRKIPPASQLHNVDFQIARGLLGVSM